ncbi:P-loop NTPase fold protein [Streptomyces eurythermus]|uniref:P-loop NTPase fold protein n=1 Tax=Streptomyces eurythermus TaxID=42237 RepID=UPI0033E41163
MDDRYRSLHERLLGVVWEDRAEAEIYGKAVELCLEEPDITRRLGARPGATAEAIRSAMAAELNVMRALAPVRPALDTFRAQLSASRKTDTDQADRLQAMTWSWRTGSPPALCLLTLSLWLQDRPGFIVYVAATLAAVATLAALLRPDDRRTLGLTSAVICLAPVQAFRSLRASRAGNIWAEDLRVYGVKPLMKRVLDALLGDDPDELLFPDNYEGFRTTAGHAYFVPSAEAEQLTRKMGHMDGGTIAICGPRGSGKTTLLEHCVAGNDFSVITSAPATFAPQDFLVSLFSAVCERYIKSEGYQVPDFTRITTTGRAVRRAMPWVRRTTGWLSYALPAALLIGLGTFAALRSLEQRHGRLLTQGTRHFLDEVTSLVADVWRGENIGAGLALALLGVMVWRSRKNRVVLRTLKDFWVWGTAALGLTLVAVPVVSLFRDPELKHDWDRFLADDFASVSLMICALPYLFSDSHGNVGHMSIGRWDIPRRRIRAAWRLLSVAGIAYVYVRHEALRDLVTDDDNPVRVLSVLTGIALIKIGKWNPEPGESDLVRRCRNQLYRLRTVQSTTSTLTLGASPIVSLGSSHATAVTTVPPNLPALVADFRELLADIARTRSLQGKRTVIAIDELDRLGSDAKALAFLGEVKAVFGVPHVHYLVSVAEDVGAAFVRRGLPYRDATDSSLDDVVHVQPGTLAQSGMILQKRAPGISAPYVALVHALSGGIPRDLVRYGRRVMETETKAGTVELSDISRMLVLDELYETLSGFRVLLSRQEWTEAASPVLESFRRLMARLKSGPGDMRALRRDLTDFAEGRRQFDFSGDFPHLEAETSRLLVEASSYAYFSLTLLDIFGTEGFTRRSERAYASPEGHPQLLAEARQELAVSPYTARSLLRSIRRAWGLPVQGRVHAPRGAGRRSRPVPGQRTP